MQIHLLRLWRCQVCKVGTQFRSGMCKMCLKRFDGTDLKSFDRYLNHYYPKAPT